MGRVLHKVKEVECSPHRVHQMNRRDTTVKREANNGAKKKPADIGVFLSSYLLKHQDTFQKSVQLLIWWKSAVVSINFFGAKGGF